LNVEPKLAALGSEPPFTNPREKGYTDYPSLQENQKYNIPERRLSPPFLYLNMCLVAIAWEGIPDLPTELFQANRDEFFEHPPKTYTNG